MNLPNLPTAEPTEIPSARRDDSTPRRSIQPVAKQNNGRADSMVIFSAKRTLSMERGVFIPLKSLRQKAHPPHTDADRFISRGEIDRFPLRERGKGGRIIKYYSSGKKE